MRRETALAASVVVLLAAAAVAAAAVPGVLAQPRPDRPERPGHLAFEEMTIERGAVGGERATLSVTTYLHHRGGPSRNLTLRLRAVDAESGLVAATESVPVDAVDGTREVAVTGNVTVPREGAYHIEATLYRNRTEVAAGETDVRGVGSLRPDYARSAVRFHRFERTDIPAVQFAVEDVADNRTRMRVSTHLTNRGDAPAGDLRVVFVARQADSNIVADREAVGVGTVRSGRTARPNATLVVPDGYNYYLDAVLWKDGVVVGTARSAANLDPTERIAANVTTRDVGLETGDFESDDSTTTYAEAGDMTTTEVSSGQPGFGAAVALVALLAAAGLARRRYHD